MLFLQSQPDGRMILKTERLEIRELVRKNALSVLAVMDSCPEGIIDPDIKHDPDLIGAMIAGDMTDQYRFFGYGLWGVFKDGLLIGLAGLKNGSAAGVAEISYAILPQYRRKGYMTEAMLSVLRYAEDQGFSCVEARIPDGNRASAAFFSHLADCCQRVAVDSFSFTL